MLADAITAQGGSEAVSLRVAEQYLSRWVAGWVRCLQSARAAHGCRRACDRLEVFVFPAGVDWQPRSKTCQT